MLKACIGLKQIEFLDRRHCGLPGVPEDIYRHERTLEELLLDFNGIQDLPPKFFRLTSLRKLTISENDLNRIPPGIANLTRLVELDISKNAIEDVPQNMQFCRSLHLLDISSNPLLRTPESIASIVSLGHLNINDVGIPRLPLEIGNLSNLKVLEARENALKSLPGSISKLKKLQRLDVGNNEIEALPAEMGLLVALTELWVDTNLLSALPESLSDLRDLMVLDVTKNRLEYLPTNFASLTNLSDLHISENCLEGLPEAMGQLQALSLLKFDLNHFVSIPESMGQLHCVTELLLYDNMLETLPPSLFDMQSLVMLNLDRNHLLEIPATIGKCKTLHVISLRENELCELPEEMGHLPALKVLDIVNNRIKCLPLSFSQLDLDAFWIDGNQPQPLVCLEPRPDLENSAVNMLFCPFLPQRGHYNSSMENFLEGSSIASDPTSTSYPNTSFSSLNRAGSFSKSARLGVAFDPSLGPPPEEGPSKLVRFPTPFRKDLKALKAKRKKYKPQAIPSTTIFRKGSISSREDLTHSVAIAEPNESPDPTLSQSASLNKSQDSLGDFRDIVEKFGTSPNGKQIGKSVLTEYEQEPSAGLTKMSGRENLSQEDLTDTTQQTQPNGESDVLKVAVYADETAEVPSGSVVRSIDVSIDIEKVPGRTLGFSVAGGRGSTPAYEDVDDSIYVTKIANGGLAEQDGRLRLGDKLLSVNEVNMVNATHAEAVAALKSVLSICKLVVSREVLVVLPNEGSEGEEEEEEEEEEEATPPHEGEEDAAKRIVADVMDRSVKRVDLEKGVEPPSGRQHDNYINFDIAQIVVKESKSDAPSIMSSDTGSPLHSVTKPWEVPGVVKRESRPSISMSIDEDEENYPTERVVLDRSIGRLGLSIVGGADHVSRVFGQGRPGVYVSKISKGGAAMATGKLRLGDRILEVNKFNVKFSTHQQAVQWLVSQEGDIELVVQHVPQPPGLLEVHLKRLPNQKLGLSIRGGGKGSKGNPLDPNDEGIFISKIAKGGAAERSGKLAVGMRIVEVNGTSLLGASHSQSVQALRGPGDLFITVCDGFDVQEVMRRKSLADMLDDDKISSVTAHSHVPLSAASSMVLDKAIHGLLSESVDGLSYISSTTPRKTARSQSAVAPTYFSLLHSNTMSHSSHAINTTSPLTKEEDFDGLLEDLARYKLETSESIRRLDASTPSDRRASSPISPIPLSEIIAPLENGGLGSIENAFSEEDLMADPTIGDEVSQVKIKDTSSMLEDLDSELSTMCDEVSKGEDEMNKVQEVKDEDITPKVKRRGTRHLKVAPTPVNPGLVSPETRRRAEQIRINISPPPDAEASEAAVQSIIGEVFSDISFEEFEKSSKSSRSSGIFTPTSEKSGTIDEVLSALEEISFSGLNKKNADMSSAESMEGPEPSFGVCPPVKERSRTMPATLPAESDHTHNDVTLRVNAHNSNSDRRKSAPIPDVLEEKPSSPEHLTFQEKLALHKKVADVLPSGDTKTTSSSTLPSVDPVSVPTPVNRPPDMDRTASPTIASEGLPSTFSDRIAFLRDNQAKAGMEPVKIKESSHSDKRMSAEEKRMARVVKSEESMESSSAPNDTHPDPANTSPSLTILANSNCNNNTRHSVSPPHVYVSQHDGDRGDESSKSISGKKIPTTLV